MYIFLPVALQSPGIVVCAVSLICAPGEYLGCVFLLPQDRSPLCSSALGRDETCDSPIHGRAVFGSFTLPRGRFASLALPGGTCWEYWSQWVHSRLREKEPEEEVLRGGGGKSVRRAPSERHFFPIRGEAAVWEKVVRRRSDSNTRRRHLRRDDLTVLPSPSPVGGSPKGNVQPSEAIDFWAGEIFIVLLPGREEDY